jgi:hypothetical protein
MVSPDPERDRRNVRLAWIHVLIALGFVAAFFWVQASR